MPLSTLRSFALGEGNWPWARERPPAGGLGSQQRIVSLILRTTPPLTGLESPMSLRAQLPTPVPDETARVARAAFPQGNTYLRLRDELGPLFADEDFAGLYPV